ncbi:MAG: hypothetical protein K2O38_03250 [Muribaculaceae bacterium]|nr:hypothetical protein [Muribaculaceae bacterium]
MTTQRLISCIKPLLFAAAVLCSIQASGQTSLHSTDVDNLIFQHQINSIDEFILRFNEASTTDRQNPDSQSLRSLFDLKTIANNPEILVDSAQNFIDAICENEVHLNFADSKWVARAECVGSLEGKEVTFTLYLTIEQSNNGAFKWALSRVEGSSFELTPKDQKLRPSISPTDHELNFMSLIEITDRQKSNISDLLSTTNQLNRASVFCSLIYYGLLKLTQIKDVSFLFYQVPGHLFIVKDFPRNDSNAGWLIYEWSKIPPDIEKTPITEDRDVDIFNPIPLDSDSAMSIVNRFVTNMSSFLCSRNPAMLENIRQAISGPYLFTADGCKILLPSKHTSPSGATSWQQLLAGILNPEEKANRCSVSDLQIIQDNQSTRNGKFTVVSGNLTIGNHPELAEKVLFFLHGNQIAGMRPQNNSD